MKEDVFELKSNTTPLRWLYVYELEAMDYAGMAWDVMGGRGMVLAFA